MGHIFMGIIAVLAPVNSEIIVITIRITEELPKAAFAMIS
jgi:hypothetical protein